MCVSAWRVTLFGLHALESTSITFTLLVHETCIGTWTFSRKMNWLLQRVYVQH